MVSESPDKSPVETDESFISRWSRRKQRGDQSAAASSATLNPPPTESALDKVDLADQADAADLSEQIPVDQSDSASVVADTGNSTEPENTEPEEELLTDADMPALETITSKSDMSMFFNRGVSRELRKAALKRLFGLPALNITDGLNDYDEDYTTFEPLGDIVTSDMRFHAERKARLAEEEEARRLAEAEAADADESENENEALSDASSQETATDAEQLTDADDVTDTGEPEMPAENTQAEHDPLDSTDAEEDRASV